METTASEISAINGDGVHTLVAVYMHHYQLIFWWLVVTHLQNTPVLEVVWLKSKIIEQAGEAMTIDDKTYFAVLFLCVFDGVVKVSKITKRLSVHFLQNEKCSLVHLIYF